MKLPDFSLRGVVLPRLVAISVFVIVASAVAFGVLMLTLGSARDDAVSDNIRLKAQVPQATKDVAQARADYDYVMANQTKFEELLQGDRLIPHTRREAARQLQTIALQHGLTSLSWDFALAADTSLAAVASQVQPKGPSQQVSYRVNVENIELKIGSALDGQIYRFLVDVSQNFPGAAIIQSVSLVRAANVTDDALHQLSQGQDAGLVRGEVRFLWRTAQANDTEKK